MNEFLRAALAYATRGLSVIPIQPREKKPLAPWEPSQSRRATEDEINSWWSKWPDANIGIVTGAISELVVIDLDSAEAKEMLKELFPTFDLATVPRSRTGKGWQLFFKHPGTPIQNRAGIIPGLDVRGDGGYVVAPPSIHPNGKVYKWQVPLTGELPKLPVDLFKLISSPTGNGSESGYCERFDTAKALAGVPEGKRDEMLFRLACKLRAADVPQDMAETLIFEAARNCEPLFPESMALEKVRRAYERYPARGGNSLPDSFLPPKEGVGKETNFNPQSAADLLSRQPEEIPWIWKTLIAKGVLFLLVAFMKIGKSTFSYKLAVAIAQGIPFLGRETLKGGVLILAVEEHPRDVERRLRRFGMRPEDPIYVHTGRLENNEATIKALRDFIVEKGIILVLVDSLSRYSNVRDENDNAGVIREVSPLLDLARETGAAIGLIHHERKSGGEDGRNIRGGSALFGLVDQAIILERRQGEINNQRLIKTLGRYDESPRELVIELVGDEYKVLGTPEEMGEVQALAKARETLSVEPMDIKTIAKEADLKEKATRKALERLRELGETIREGEGKKNSPFTYRLPYSDSFLSQHSLKGEATNPDRSGDGKSCQTFDL